MCNFLAIAFKLSSVYNYNKQTSQSVQVNYQAVAISEAILAKLKNLPLEQQQQILDFVEFIAAKYLESQLTQRESSQKRVAGLQKGKIWISEDFNEPLELKKIEE